MIGTLAPAALPFPPPLEGALGTATIDAAATCASSSECPMDLLDALFNLLVFPRSTVSVLAAIIAFFVANQALGEGASLVISLAVGILILGTLLMVWPLRDKKS
jgi:hypothetical protein